MDGRFFLGMVAGAILMLAAILLALGSRPAASMGNAGGRAGFCWPASSCRLVVS